MLASSSYSLSNNGSYSNDRASGFETDFSVDPASGGFFQSDFKKHDDLKNMLDSNKDNLKLEAMKRIIGMVAKGRDASMLFPAVVKNVVSKNIEIKKLVYVYLERYAEEQQDLALLSISTFQRALKEPNPLIRAGALRVLSSVRVRMISPIVMLAIRDASSDMSSYVRKTAAHAIPKLYSLDQEMKSELITIIQKLLSDKTVLVIGSAVMAFTEVCPERLDLIHNVYRKLCVLLVDVDEWGQVTIVNMLTRYARMQFTDPNLLNREEDPNVPFYDSGSDTSEKPVLTLDPDHRLLLRSTRPLLQSRNAAVVMAVAQLYHHAAPKNENPLAAKALVRLLRSHVEVQSIVLNSIASISATNKGMFEPYLKSFLIRTSDPTNIKLLKLEILTNLASESNVSTILRELRTYISHNDKQFVAATIQAIGRCACSISDVTDSCLNGLVMLLSSKDEIVVAESVVVIKRLLQTRAADPEDIITHMAKLLDSITVGQARAAILWLLGEHSEKVPKIAPDILRKLAKTFPDEHDIVKLQVLNLAVKLYITIPEQPSQLAQYVFNLARYDQNYDIRDKARMLKLFIPSQEGKITSHAERIFLVAKPAPILQSHFRDYEGLQLGSLSHYIKQRANGYESLPPFPDIAPPGDLRNVEPVPTSDDSRGRKYSDAKNKNFFSWENDASSVHVSGSSDSESSSGESSDDDDNSSEYEEESSSEESDDEKNSKSSSSSSSSSMSSEDEDESSSKRYSDSDTSNHGKMEVINDQKSKPATAEVVQEKPIERNSINKKSDRTKSKPEKSNLDLLLELEENDKAGPVMVPSLGELLNMPNMAETSSTNNKIEDITPTFLNTKPIELLSKMQGRGLSITYRYTRNQNVFAPHMTNLNMIFTNHTSEDISDIRLGKKEFLGSTTTAINFAPLLKLTSNCNLSTPLNIDFNDSTKPVNFEIQSSLGTFDVTIKPDIGELIRPVTMSNDLFMEQQQKLRGMSEHNKKIPPCSDDIIKNIQEFLNIGICPSGDPNYIRFAGKTLTMGGLILVAIFKEETQSIITVNCENPVFGSVLLNELVNKLKV